MLENISIVLVEPSGDENVGMAARAMKNCGLTDLRLVKPAPFKTGGAKKWACNANDVLHRAKVFKSFDDAISDTTFVVGLSRREGKLRPPILADCKAASTIYMRAKKGRVALVFGREADGLDRSELDLCDFVWTIRTSKLYPSLNLAQAVMVVGYKIFEKQRSPSTKLGASKEARGKENPPLPPFAKGGVGGFEEIFVSKKEIAPVLKQLSRSLMCLGYDDHDGGKLRRRILREFERLFGRGGLFHKDLNMLLGLAARIEERACPPRLASSSRVAGGVKE